MTKPTKNWRTDTVFGVIANAEGGLSISMVAESTLLDLKSVQHSLDVLRSRGLAARTGKGIYEITAAGKAAYEAGAKIRSGPCGPLTGRRAGNRDSLRARLWRALRVKKKAAIPDLLAVVLDADADRAAVNRATDNAQHYLRALVAAGYVAVLPNRAPGTAPTSNGFKKFLIVEDPGPEAPIYRVARHEVYDPNTGETIRLDGEGGNS